MRARPTTGFRPRAASDFLAIALVALLLCFMVGCRANRPIPGVAKIRAQCSAQSDNDYYFPVRTFSTAEGSGSELNYEYGGYLARVGEPSLSCGPGPDEAYRLVWTHAFRPDPVVIRISRTAEKYSVIAYRLEAGAYANTAIKIVTHTEKLLGSEQWHTLTAAVEQANFFFMPVWHIRTASDPYVLDGDNWVLEGRVGSSYHAILRGTLEERRVAFNHLCRLFFQFVGFDVPGELQPRP